MRLTSVLFFVVVALVLRTLGRVGAADLPALLAIGLGDLLANGLFAFASSRGLVSVVSVLGSMYPVVTVCSPGSCCTSGCFGSSRSASH